MTKCESGHKSFGSMDPRELGKIQDVGGLTRYASYSTVLRHEV